MNNFGYEDIDEPSSQTIQDVVFDVPLYLDQLHSDIAIYTDLQLPIIPLCSCNHAGMSLTHRQSCKSPGKSPIIANWTKHHDTTEEQAQKWFEKQTPLNVGLVLGKTDHWNLAGVDIDGELGEMVLKELAGTEVPVTWEYNTSNGRRLLYSLPADLITRKFRRGENKIGELAFLVSGQQTVLPPSRHASGRFYEWVTGRSPSDIDIAMAPQWLIDKVESGKEQESPRVTSDEWEKRVGVGERSTHLTKLAGSLISMRSMNPETVKSMLYTVNKKQCDPPLAEAEIDAMVDSIYLSETSKRKNNTKVKDTFDATIFANQFLQLQESAGIKWFYNSTEGCFFSCAIHQGPWQRVSLTDQLLDSSLRDIIYQSNPTWARTSNVNEIKKVLQEQTADNSKDYLFDLGQNHDMEHIFCSNGMLNWKERKLVPFDWQTYSTVQLPIQWSDEPDLDLLKVWEDALIDWIPDEVTRKFVQEYIGYSLLPDCSYRTSVFLLGSGANGKSLFLEIIKPLFGRWISLLPLENINDRFSTITLQNKLINICSDIDAKFLAETGNLKRLVAGEEIKGEVKFGAQYAFKPVCKLIFSANTLPKSIDKSEGWFSRWRIVGFPNSFKPNPGYKMWLESTLGTPQALNTLLHWGLDGLDRLYQQGGFSCSSAMEKQMQEYRSENDSVCGFLDTFIEREVGGFMTTVSLYKTYAEYCGDTGAKAVGQIEFTKRCQNMGVSKTVRTIKGKSCNCFTNIKFKDLVADAFDVKQSYQLNESLRVVVR